MSNNDNTNLGDKVVNISFQDEVFEKIQVKAISEDKTIEKYIEDVIEEEVTVFKLSEGFKYKVKDRQLINPQGQQVTLTRKEEKVLNILIDNVNNIVELEVFFRDIWKNKTSDATLYSLRNFIKSIRDKTTYEIIQNVSGIGYSIKIA